VDRQLETRKAMSQVKVIVAKREFHNVVVEDAHLPAFEQRRQAIDAVRG
jgi:hypothetical protein